MELETRYPRPSDSAIAEVLAQCLPGHRGDHELIETGSSNLVILTSEAAVRIARDPLAAAELLRTQQLVDHLPALPFAVPTSLNDPIKHGELTAVATRRLPGEPHPAGSGDPVVLRAVLDAIHGINPDPIHPWLAEPHAYSGGADWLDIIRTQVIPLLPQQTRPAAHHILDQMEDLDEATPAINHGDLAGANLLWQDSRVTGVLDWDLAAWCDPADDVASLAMWHGWELLDQLADGATVSRARRIRETYPLQQVAFVLNHGRPQEEIERAVQRAAQRLT